MSTGPDAFTLFRRVYREAFPSRSGKEPHYPTERLAPPERFVISTEFSYEHGGDTPVRFKINDNVEYISGDGSMDILARSPASEKKARSVFIDTAIGGYRGIMPDVATLLSVGSFVGPALEAISVSVTENAEGHFVERTPQIYAEWRKSLRGW